MANKISSGNSMSRFFRLFFYSMPSITSFTRPPHYEIRDVEAAGHLEVTRQSNPLFWVAGWAIAACCAVGVWNASQPQVSYMQIATTSNPQVSTASVSQATAPKPAEIMKQATVAAGTALTTFAPLAAQAGEYSSAKAWGDSIFAGGAVLALIAGAVVLVSQFDKIERR